MKYYLYVNYVKLRDIGDLVTLWNPLTDLPPKQEIHQDQKRCVKVFTDRTQCVQRFHPPIASSFLLLYFSWWLVLALAFKHGTNTPLKMDSDETESC